jgi:hypothetical protein
MQVRACAGEKESGAGFRGARATARRAPVSPGVAPERRKETACERERERGRKRGRVSVCPTLSGSPLPGRAQLKAAGPRVCSRPGLTAQGQINSHPSTECVRTYPTHTHTRSRTTPLSPTLTYPAAHTRLSPSHPKGRRGRPRSHLLLVIHAVPGPPLSPLIASIAQSNRVVPGYEKTACCTEGGCARRCCWCCVRRGEKWGQAYVHAHRKRRRIRHRGASAVSRMLAMPRRRPVRSRYSLASRACSCSPSAAGSSARFKNRSSCGGVSVHTCIGVCVWSAQRPPCGPTMPPLGVAPYREKRACASCASARPG